MNWPNSANSSGRTWIVLRRGWISLGRTTDRETGVAVAKICALLKVRGFYLDFGWH